MHMGSQGPLVVWLPNMHGRHPWAAKGLCIICSKLLGLLLGNHACAVDTQSKWSTETACNAAVDHRDGGLLMEYLFGVYQTTILSAK